MTLVVSRKGWLGLVVQVGRLGGWRSGTRLLTFLTPDSSEPYTVSHRFGCQSSPQADIGPDGSDGSSTPPLSGAARRRPAACCHTVSLLCCHRHDALCSVVDNRTRFAQLSTQLMSVCGRSHVGEGMDDRSQGMCSCTAMVAVPVA